MVDVVAAGEIAMMANVVTAGVVASVADVGTSSCGGRMMADVMATVGCYHGCCGETVVGATSSCGGFHHSSFGGSWRGSCRCCCGGTAAEAAVVTAMMSVVVRQLKVPLAAAHGSCGGAGEKAVVADVARQLQWQPLG